MRNVLKTKWEQRVVSAQLDAALTDIGAMSAQAQQLDAIARRVDASLRDRIRTVRQYKLVQVKIPYVAGRPNCELTPAEVIDEIVAIGRRSLEDSEPLSMLFTNYPESAVKEMRTIAYPVSPVSSMWVSELGSETSRARPIYLVQPCSQSSVKGVHGLLAKRRDRARQACDIDPARRSGN